MVEQTTTDKHWNRREFWKQIVPAQPGWLALYIGPEPGEWFTERVICWALYDEDPSEFGHPSSNVLGIIAPDISCTAPAEGYEEDFDIDCVFLRYVHEDDLPDDTDLEKASRDLIAVRRHNRDHPEQQEVLEQGEAD